MIWISYKKELASICLVMLLLCSCGKKEDQQSQSPGQPQADSTTSAKSQDETTPAKNPPDISTQIADAETKNRQALLEMNQGKVIEPVDIGTLKGMLPADLPGMKRSNASAERNQMMGIDVAQAEADYESGDGEASVCVKIIDLGNLTGPMKMGLTGWTLSQYSRETDTGYEKTTTYKDNKAMEEYDNDAKEGVLRVFVADRFVVEIEGSQIGMDKIKQVMDKIDLKKLETAASGK